MYLIVHSVPSASTIPSLQLFGTTFTSNLSPSAVLDKLTKSSNCTLPPSPLSQSSTHANIVRLFSSCTPLLSTTTTSKTSPKLNQKPTDHPSTFLQSHNYTAHGHDPAALSSFLPFNPLGHHHSLSTIRLTQSTTGKRSSKSH